MNEIWYSSVSRLVAIFAAIGLYGVALFAIIKRSRKPSPLPSGNTGHLPFDYSGPERRLYPRAKIGVVVRYKLCRPEGGMQIFKEGKLKDISEGGLLLEAPEKLAVNDKLEFKIKLPGVSHFMLLRGIVVWVKEIEAGLWWHKCGISISDIDPNDRKQIAKYVASQQCSVK